MGDSIIGRRAFPSIGNHPEGSIATACWALARGRKFGRPMTGAERMLVATISARPNHTLTLDSNLGSRAEVVKAFRNFVKRIDRALARRRPRDPERLVYMATIATARGSNRFHVHALLWQRLHAPVVHGHARDVGFGGVMLRRLPEDLRGDVHYWNQAAYVLGQQEPVFGTKHHERHEDRPVWGRRVLHPQASTLARHCPNLLSALQAAKDPALPDDALLTRLPKFT